MAMSAKGVNGTVTFDGQQVVIERTGAMARLTVGKGRKVIPLSSITAVQWKQPGMVRGFIAVTVPGGNENRSRFGSQTTSAAKDENSVLVDRKQRVEFEAIRDAIEQAISRGPAAPTSGVADELAKLAHLRDTGVITEADFQAQKAKLIQ